MQHSTVTQQAGLYKYGIFKDKKQSVIPSVVTFDTGILWKLNKHRFN